MDVIPIHVHQFPVRALTVASGRSPIGRAASDSADPPPASSSSALDASGVPGGVTGAAPSSDDEADCVPSVESSSSRLISLGSAAGCGSAFPSAGVSSAGTASSEIGGNGLLRHWPKHRQLVHLRSAFRQGQRCVAQVELEVQLQHRTTCSSPACLRRFRIFFNLKLCKTNLSRITNFN